MLEYLGLVVTERRPRQTSAYVAQIPEGVIPTPNPYGNTDQVSDKQIFKAAEELEWVLPERPKKKKDADKVLASCEQTPATVAPLTGNGCTPNPATVAPKVVVGSEEVVHNASGLCESSFEQQVSHDGVGNKKPVSAKVLVWKRKETPTEVGWRYEWVGTPNGPA